MSLSDPGWPPRHALGPVISARRSPTAGLGEGGFVDFDAAPAAGAAVRAGFRFDVPVRFAEDRLEVSGAGFAAGELPHVPLVEVREG